MTTISSEINDNLNIIKTLINEINNDIEANCINFENIINLIDNLFILNNNVGFLKNTNISIEEYNEKLTAALNAFENKDYMMFNEILYYDLKPLLEFWNENIN